MTVPGALLSVVATILAIFNNGVEVQASDSPAGVAYKELEMTATSAKSNDSGAEPSQGNRVASSQQRSLTDRAVAQEQIVADVKDDTDEIGPDGEGHERVRSIRMDVADVALTLTADGSSDITVSDAQRGTRLRVTVTRQGVGRIEFFDVDGALIETIVPRTQRRGVSTVAGGRCLR